MKCAVMDGLCSVITSLEIASYLLLLLSLKCIPVLIFEKQLRNTASDSCDSPIVTFF
jgi:hypothetical protein